MPTATVSATQTIGLNNSTFVFQNVSAKDVTSKAVSVATNHILFVDVSGSMSWDLPNMRTHMKNKLSSLVKEGDTITIGYFSGRNQFGVLVEEVEIATLQDLTSIHQAIDRFLKPICLTGFKEPLQETKRVIQRIKGNRPDSAFSFFFLTDGHDNQWSEREILQACEELEADVVSATIVEYGYYCNHNLLVKTF